MKHIEVGQCLKIDQTVRKICLTYGDIRQKNKYSDIARQKKKLKSFEIRNEQRTRLLSGVPGVHWSTTE